jgi:ABC-type molybdate transport system substrate-binding protein
VTRIRWLARLLLIAAAMALPAAALAADVRVMISAGFFHVYSELSPAFERTIGHHLVTTRGPSMGDSPESIPTRLAHGETADVVILDGGAADKLADAGLLRADSKVTLARSLIGMVVKPAHRSPISAASRPSRRRCSPRNRSLARTPAAALIFRRSCSPSSTLRMRCCRRTAGFAGRRRASRSPPWSRAARPRSVFSR